MHIRPLDLKAAYSFTGVIADTGHRTIDTGPLEVVRILDSSPVEESLTPMFMFLH